MRRQSPESVAAQERLLLALRDPANAALTGAHLEVRACGRCS